MACGGRQAARGGAWLSKGQKRQSWTHAWMGAGQMTGPLWEEEFGNGLPKGLGVNFRTELDSNSLSFSQ